MQNEPELELQLRRLIIGLTDQEIRNGHEFLYDNGMLYADDVAEIAFSSILCLSQALAKQTGMADFSYIFTLEEPANPVFPLQITGPTLKVNFFQIAPFIVEIFDKEVMSFRQDLTLLFEQAAKIIEPSFSLATHINHDNID